MDNEKLGVVGENLLAVDEKLLTVGENLLAADENLLTDSEKLLTYMTQCRRGNQKLFAYSKKYTLIDEISHSVTLRSKGHEWYCFRYLIGLTEK